MTMKQEDTTTTTQYYMEKRERIQNMLCQTEHVEHKVVDMLVATEHYSRALPNNPILRDLLANTRKRLFQQLKLKRMRAAIAVCDKRIDDDEEGTYGGGAERKRLRRTARAIARHCTNSSNYLAAKTNFEFMKRAPSEHANMCSSLHSPDGLTHIMEHVTSKHNSMITVDTFDEITGACACLVLAGVGFGRSGKGDAPFATPVSDAPRKVLVISHCPEKLESFRADLMEGCLGSVRDTCPLLRSNVIMAAYTAESIHDTIKRLVGSRSDRVSVILVDNDRRVNFQKIREIANGQQGAMCGSTPRTAADTAFVQLMAGALYPVTDACVRLVDALMIVTTDAFDSWVHGFRYCEIYQK